MAFLYLESEKKLDGVCKRGRRGQAELSGQAKEKQVEEGPGKSQRRSEPLGHRETLSDFRNIPKKCVQNYSSAVTCVISRHLHKHKPSSFYSVR